MSEELNRRRFLWAATAAAGITGLAGCSGTGSNGTRTSDGTSREPDPENTEPGTLAETNSDDNTSSQSFEIDNGILTEMPSHQDILGAIENYTKWNGDVDEIREVDRTGTLEVRFGGNPASGAVANNLSGSPEEFFVVQPYRSVYNSFGGDIYDKEINEVMDGTPLEFVDMGGIMLTESPQLVKEGGHELIVGLTEKNGKTLAGKVNPVKDVIEPDEAKEWVENFLNDEYGNHGEDVEEFMEGGSGSGNLAMDVGGALVLQSPRVQGVSILPYMGENGWIDTGGDVYRDAEDYLSSLDRQAGQ
jgi:hypothetical protein